MLSMIKDIINQKKDFMEAAELIFEDAIGNNLDDAIILGEDSDADMQLEPTFEDNDDENEKPEDPEVKNDEEDNENDGDIMDEPIGGDDNKPDESSEDNGITNEPISDEPITDEQNVDDTVPPSDDTNIQPIPGSDELPEPVSNVTGEPVADDGILSMELDLGSNTPKDILPVPPSHAGDAVVSDDIMDQRIDSGFGESSDVTKEVVKDDDLGELTIDSKKGEELMNKNKNMKENVDDLLSEAITIADSSEESTPEDTTSETSAEDVAVDNSVEEPATTGEEDNEVTAAVKDKVAEADSPAYDGDANNAKEDLMKKLGNITKNLEDVKRAVMSSIQ